MGHVAYHQPALCGPSRAQTTTGEVCSNTEPSSGACNILFPPMPAIQSRPRTIRKTLFRSLKNSGEHFKSTHLPNFHLQSCFSFTHFFPQAWGCWASQHSPPPETLQTHLKAEDPEGLILWLMTEVLSMCLAATRVKAVFSGERPSHFLKVFAEWGLRVPCHHKSIPPC